MKLMKKTNNPQINQNWYVMEIYSNYGESAVKSLEEITGRADVIRTGYGPFDFRMPYVFYNRW